MASSDRNTKTYRQAQHGLDLLDKVAPTNEAFQRLLRGRKILDAVAECTDLSLVDVAEILRLFSAPFEPKWELNLGPQIQMIRDRAGVRKWALDDFHLSMLVTEEVQRPRTPEGVLQSLDLWLGVSVEYNWQEMTAWLEASLESVGMKLDDRIGAEGLYLRGGPDPGIGFPNPTSRFVLKHSYIDLDRIAVPQNAFLRELGKYRPRLDLMVLLAMNPSICPLMGTKVPTGLAMTGFCDQHVRTMPIIERRGDTLVIDWLKV